MKHDDKDEMGGVGDDRNVEKIINEAKTYV